MTNILENPILIPVEKELLEDVIKIIGCSINKILSHNEVESVKNKLQSYVDNRRLKEVDRG